MLLSLILVVVVVVDVVVVVAELKLCHDKDEVNLDKNSSLFAAKILKFTLEKKERERESKNLHWIIF